ncbi:hypothetical protein L596_013030 [Steinernema carpocapsae]|uniref:MSP domain-containing protein n=1 Tax=Steinernema carpocapsae TaxID=34508 RepID=A0A4U5NZU8_STECR|nr:hypothetical protein L596_013030 [Steinernema carpocapsae]
MAAESALIGAHISCLEVCKSSSRHRLTEPFGLLCSESSTACFTLNKGSKRLAFKIKCNNGTHYTFKRIVGFLEVAQTKEIHMIPALI